MRLAQEREHLIMAIATINPATGEVIKTFTPLSEAEIEKKVQLAVSTFKAERKTPFAVRAQRMLKAAEILERDKDKFAHLMTLEMGKPLQGRRGGSGQMHHRVPLLRRERRAVHGRRSGGDGGEEEFCAVFADRADPGGDAVEFSVLAGVPFCGAGADGGKRWTAEAFFQRSAVRAGDRRAFFWRPDFRRVHFRRC